jgi:hypothetical protein
MAQEKESHRKPARRDPPPMLSRRPDMFTRQLGFDLALFDPVSSQLHMLNSTATAIWYHITPDRTPKNIYEVLALNFDKSSSDELVALSNDGEYFIGVLQDLNLVTENPTSPTPVDVSGITAYIPDHEISTCGVGYARPSIKTFTLQELQDRFKVDEGLVTGFSDIWVPTPGSAR